MKSPFRLLTTGSRGWSDIERLHSALESIRRGYCRERNLIVVHGDCPDGADAIVKAWALSLEGQGVFEEPHPADTDKFGPWPGAGPKRNAHMVNLGAHRGLAFIDKCTSPRCRRPGVHYSHGTTGCADLMEKALIPVMRLYA